MNDENTTATNDARVKESIEHLESEAPKARRTRGPNKPKELTPAQEVLLGVLAEVERQDEKWGEQNHPLIGGQLPSAALSFYASRANDWKAINEERVAADTVGWDSILLEEVYEALGEDDLEAALVEWEQVAAVAVNAILSGKRRLAKDAA